MRWPTLALIALVAAAPAAPHASQAAEPAGARAFVAEVYGQYALKPEERKPFTDFFDPGLRKLVKADETAAGSDNAPAMDYDPICQCQDDAGLKFRITSITGGPTAATVRVENSFSEDPSSKPILVTYRLTKVGGAWRIVDISAQDVPSLRRWLASQIGHEGG